ncbi:lipase family protein [Hymenobacter antarcticus]|uniref:Fungal lipase-type domain-containing protein n=1 Tax=Hymenobacter antarcticus TaxID=486270 RepID=A0ABP7PR31_9BACT
MKLVLIHGRAQEGKNPELLRKEWVDALHYGCARADVQLPPKTTIEFPYYGDLLADLVKQVEAPLSRDVTAKGDLGEGDESSLRGEILTEIAQNAGVTAKDVQLELGGAAIARGPGEWEWVQAMARALDKVPGLNGRFIDLFTRDAFVYLSYSNVRKQINDFVAAAIGQEPCVVLGHSLGSAVAYNVLSAPWPAQPAFPQLITVGSPLGLRAFKARLKKPLASPPCVRNWFNAYDDRDIVALNPLDKTNFGITPAVDNYNKVINFTDNRHGIAGYLADPEVARKICQFL